MLLIGLIWAGIALSFGVDGLWGEVFVVGFMGVKIWDFDFFDFFCGDGAFFLRNCLAGWVVFYNFAVGGRGGLFPAACFVPKLLIINCYGFVSMSF